MSEPQPRFETLCVYSVDEFLFEDTFCRPPRDQEELRRFRDALLDEFATCVEWDAVCDAARERMDRESGGDAV